MRRSWWAPKRNMEDRTIAKLQVALSFLWGVLTVVLGLWFSGYF